jgi:hypothetical protein
MSEPIKNLYKHHRRSRLTDLPAAGISFCAPGFSAPNLVWSLAIAEDHSAITWQHELHAIHELHGMYHHHHRFAFVANFANPNNFVEWCKTAQGWFSPACFPWARLYRVFSCCSATFCTLFAGCSSASQQNKNCAFMET